MLTIDNPTILLLFAAQDTKQLLISKKTLAQSLQLSLMQQTFQNEEKMCNAQRLRKDVGKQLKMQLITVLKSAMANFVGMEMIVKTYPKILCTTLLIKNNKILIN